MSINGIYSIRVPKTLRVKELPKVKTPKNLDVFEKVEKEVPVKTYAVGAGGVPPSGGKDINENTQYVLNKICNKNVLN